MESDHVFMSAHARPPTRALKRVALLSLMAAIAAVALSGDVQGAPPDPMTEVVVTLNAPPALGLRTRTALRLAP